MARVFILGVSSLLVGYLAIVATMYVIQRQLLFPGATGPSEIAGTSPIGQWVSIRTADGERLTALYQPPSAGKPVVLFFHGNADLIRNYAFLARAFQERGYGFLAPAFRGYPGSTGSPSEAGLIEDGLTAHSWLSQHAPASPIAILGRSLGTGVAVSTAAKRKVSALALVSAYDSIANVASEAYPYLPVKLLIRDPMNSDQLIGGVSAPKLFIHGDQDSVIPIERGQALYASASETKAFLVLKGIGHNDAWTTETVEAIVNFFDAAHAQ